MPGALDLEGAVPLAASARPMRPMTTLHGSAGEEDGADEITSPGSAGRAPLVPEVARCLTSSARDRLWLSSSKVSGRARWAAVTLL